MSKGNIYRPPTLTVDAVIFQLVDERLSALLIKRKRAPFKNSLALPGGYNSKNETTTEALARILKTKAGVRKGSLELVEQLYAFDAVARDPRGHAVSVAYMGLGEKISVHSGATTESPEFFPINQLPELAFDHKAIIQYAHERLASKLTHTNAIYALLPSNFTLTQLQKAYEAILDKELDKRNFRKKMKSFDILDTTNQYHREGAHRPALLYRFKERKLCNLVEQFE